MKLEDIAAHPMSGVRAWLPYVLMGVILVISRTVAPVKDFFVSIGVSFSNILGEAGVSAGVQPLYLPGGILVMVVIATFFIHRMSTRAMGEALKIGRASCRERV